MLKKYHSTNAPSIRLYSITCILSHRIPDYYPFYHSAVHDHFADTASPVIDLKLEDLPAEVQNYVQHDNEQFEQWITEMSKMKVSSHLVFFNAVTVLKTPHS